MTITMTADVERDVMVKTVVTEEPLTVDWDDIAGRIEPDDVYRTPWDDCDGWEHETRQLGYYDHDGLMDSRGYARMGWNTPNVLIEIDDDDIVDKWGCTGYPGCSKQVRFEAIARAKRKALDQLVRWYTDGWSEWWVRAEYGDYESSVGGILEDRDYSDYAEECLLEARHEVADEMERDGYTVVGRPAPPKPYNPINHHRERIRRNLDCS